MANSASKEELNIALILEEHNFSDNVKKDITKNFELILGFKNIKKKDYSRVEIIFARLSINLDSEFLKDF